MSGSWKLTLPCTRAEAEAIEIGEGVAGLEPPPVLMTSEVTLDDPARWRLDAYFAAAPDAAAIAAVRALVPSAAGTAETVVAVPDEDWVTLSQAGLAPISAARFFVQTGTDPAPVPAGMRGFVIPAGRAFGTGHHETTAGCLQMLDVIAQARPGIARAIDLGTGTGLLAFAALELWPAAQASATDVDPVAIEVTRANAAANGIALGEGAGQLALIVADGTRDPRIAARGRYDLIVANILAGPLVRMASGIAGIAAPGGEAVLAGLLASQHDEVVKAYMMFGWVPMGRIDLGDWTILRLRERSASVIEQD